MFVNECIECYKLSVKLEECESKIGQLETSNLELKEEISKTSSIITNYINYKKENEALKKELSLLKNSSQNSVLNDQVSYEVNRF